MSKIKRYGYIMLCCGVILLFVLPLLFLFWQSLVSSGGSIEQTGFLLSPLNRAANYLTLFEILPFWRYIGNSLLIVVIAVPLTCLVSSFAGFAWAQLPLRPRRQLLGWSGLWLIIPASAVWLFRFQLFDWVGLIDNRIVLLLPAVAGSSPLFVLLYYWTIRAFPTGLIDAARLDGASVGQIWFYMIAPLTWPTSTAVAILALVLYWGDFISPVLYIYSPSKYTLPIGVQLVNQLDATRFPLLAAAAIVMISPVLLVYLWGQRYLLYSIPNILFSSES